MKTSIVWKLLRRNISAAQLAGYAAANLAGLAIMLTALQFYRDVTAAWTDEDSFISRDYLIISKRVDGISLGGESHEFTDAEIDDISRQPWLRKLGRFTAAGFNVSASLEIWGNGMSTALFFESIPDEFFDISPRGWKWQPDSTSAKQPEVPIIMSKDYLTLYNFGFAASRGYPQVSESTIGLIPITLSVSGNGRQTNLRGRVVGFSNRLNTFAVPQTFLDWANSRMAEEPQPNPSRLILEVNTPGDPAIARYLADNGYESAGDKADNSRAAYFLSVITAVVIAVGAVISLLAFFILLLSIYLLLQKNREKLHRLMMLGYSPADVSRHYHRIICLINAAVLAGAVAAMLTGQHLWRRPLSEIGIHTESPAATIVIGTVIMLLITAGNVLAISHNVRKVFPRPRTESKK